MTTPDPLPEEIVLSPELQAALDEADAKLEPLLAAGDIDDAIDVMDDWFGIAHHQRLGRPPVNGTSYRCQGNDSITNWAPVCPHCGSPAA